MATLFDKILRASPVEIGQKSKSALDWYRDKAQNQRLTNAGGDALKTGARANMMNTPMPGSMYLFRYDAKHKETLPYWDMYPLVFPFEVQRDGFLGLNLHYLPPVLRASLFSNLTELKSGKEYQDLKLSYATLTKYSRLEMFKPCVKKYLFSHVRSKFMYVEPQEWPVAIFLPLQSFQKANASKVYADSRHSLGYHPTGHYHRKRK